ncbi:MAG TPA: hemerythrin domain-containing protein, partial [Acidimicrobiales bacterium]|nr:hemerythrin domain-containing protein [Acidimicrobiales bacterium]
EAFQQLVKELARHETAEEEVLYPSVRRSVDGGDDLADARTKEEHEGERLLAELEKRGTDGADFDAVFSELSRAVVAHAEAEESLVFPRVQEAVSAEDRAKLGKVLEMAKKAAPTHPHPNVPASATAKVLAGPMATVIDLTRDAIREAREKIAG